MDEKKPTATRDIAWEHRILCSDESCIGVIGPDGRCKECGLVYEGTLPESPSNEAVTPDVTASETPEDIQSEEFEEYDDEQEDDTEIDDPEWEQRQLCSDEGCIGVIGPDGRCKECGNPHRS